MLTDETKVFPLDGETAPKPPAIVLAIDQAEELFLAEAQHEDRPFLSLLRDLLAMDSPALIAVTTIRSDKYERLQDAPELEDVPQATLNLPSMPKGSYAEVIKGPLRRLDGTSRALRIDDALVDSLLADIEAGGAKDALPLLAFTLERLYGEFHAGGHLKLEHYNRLGRVKGSIEAAVERAFKAADVDPKVPRERNARLALLRRGLIPWLAGIDPETGAPRRRVARLSEIPLEIVAAHAAPRGQRLLSTDVAQESGETTIEPAHEALLRQWSLLQGWLKEDAGLLTVLDGIKRSSRDWAANAKLTPWLAHSAERLQTADRLLERANFAANLEPTDREYLTACREAERAARNRARRGKVLVGALVLMLAGAGGAWWRQDILKQQYHWLVAMGPSILTSDQERALQPAHEFKECAIGCPTMIVIPAGRFLMGTDDSRAEKREQPQHEVEVNAPFAVAKFELTFDEWDACASYGDCSRTISARTWGRGNRPVINITWSDAQTYVNWLSRITGKTYRLLTEAEWEYVARAKSTTHYSFGNDDALLEQYGWYASNSDKQTHQVGLKKPNLFGLYDLHGNVSGMGRGLLH